jgi:hypothetical protein
VQTANIIFPVSPSATFNPLPVSEGGGSSLSVDFDIFNNGLNHIAGIYVTTNNWFTWQVVHAQFVQLITDGEPFPQPVGENWNASFSVDTKVSTFQFVVFCYDLGTTGPTGSASASATPAEIWNTNNGSTFQVTPTEI